MDSHVESDPSNHSATRPNAASSGTAATEFFRSVDEAAKKVNHIGVVA
jgi:hypothetical protein